MVETITSISPRRKTTRNKERRFTRIHQLENEKGQKTRVCQKMFLSTVGLTADKTNGTALSKSGGSQTNDVSDKRGKLNLRTKNKNKNAKTSDLVNHHPLGYFQVSVTIMEVTLYGLYISPEHNISAMFKGFCKKYKDVKISYAYYYKKVKKN